MMNSIRKLITPQSVVKSMRPSGIILPTRSMIYLHEGPRVRGLKRESAAYLKSPKGLEYGETPENLSRLNEFLGEEYKLPSKVALQVLTHKSFAHGFKPFNEKLAIFGSHFLKVKLSLYQLQADNAQSNTNSAINGLVFDVLGTEKSKALLKTNVLAEFVRRQQLGESIFWKKRDPLITNAHTSGENSVYAKTLESLVGAILLQHGKEKADKFINQHLLNPSSDSSLISLAK